MSSSVQLVIGASRGLGLALVTELLSRDSSSKVFATARDVAAAPLKALSETYPGRLVILQLDSTNEETIKSAAVELAKYTKAVDAVHVVAGIAAGNGSLFDLTASDFKANFETNVVGSFLAIREFLPFLERSTASQRTLNVLSTAAASIAAQPQVGAQLMATFKLDSPPLLAYGTSKAALNYLVAAVAAQANPKGIAVIAMHPGLVATDMAAGAPPEHTIQPDFSAQQMLKVISNYKIGDAVFKSYDGTDLPW